jgi:DNA-binding NarL/FixJ family response regulator
MPSSPLSPRELQVLDLVSAAASNKHIARALGLSVHTVKRHVARTMGKLGAKSRAEAAALCRAMQRGAVQPDPEPLEAFTAREIDVIAHVVSGASNTEIAMELSVSVNTVKRHTANILDKLAVSSRIAAAALMDSRVNRAAIGIAQYHEEPIANRNFARAHDGAHHHEEPRTTPHFPHTTPSL